MSGNDVSTAETAHSDQNLVYSQMKTRRLRIIYGILIVGSLISLCLVGVALYYIFNDEVPTEDNDIKKDGIQLEDILGERLAAQGFNGSWSSGSSVIYRDNLNILEFDVKKNVTTILLKERPEYATFTKSADGQLLLLSKNFNRLFRWSYSAQYDILNITSGKVTPLTIEGSQKAVSLAQWSPVGNGIIINYKQNLYWKPTAFADEVAITNDTISTILNGIPDWVYEEEVFGSNSATWFNPAGTHIAFIRFDDSPTHPMNFPYYGAAGDLQYQYPIDRYIPYPKAGSSNPRVTLFTSDLALAAAGQQHLTQIPVASALNTESDYIITVVSWLNNTNVLSVWMNRKQTFAHIQVSPDTFKRTEIFSLEAKTGWVDLFSAPLKNSQGSKIALILPQAQDDGNEYHQVYTLVTTRNSSPEAITKGKFVVQSILHWDKLNDIIFYTANTEKNSEVTHIYAVKAQPDKTPECLTCGLVKSDGIEQTYYNAEFNTDHELVISALGPGIPVHGIYQWSYTNNKVQLSKIMDWETNEELRKKVKSLAMPSTEIHVIPLENDFTAKVLLQLPPNLDRSGKTKYPMLVDVYGGPGADSVTNKWLLDWGTYLSSNHSVIIAKIDGRGSGLRGDKLLHAIYLKLGTVEIADQIDVTRKLQEKFSFIDRNHTGIWGWSYGGYAAAMALANDSGSVFKCAASIAPVTDWAYYDSIYTERYMDLPTTNAQGYANGRLSTRANHLRGKKFLLVHGTLDDNVHYQQAMILAKNLERADILFKQISYPDENHGLGGVRPHLYHSLDRFFGECFGNKRMMGMK